MVHKKIIGFILLGLIALGAVGIFALFAAEQSVAGSSKGIQGQGENLSVKAGLFARDTKILGKG